ncbi:terminase small subunit [Urbifossiella limnaea]|uniref:Terminase small subunit n=1 Tax=Urbifossiella limnaea TaxID=2528023 RepID=A0A517XX91_9BACT|nr:terminase small subunit [Urbifossiella limnaea]QDU22105.1 Terminase small subunit [Urbifossiella limnaea]
MAEYLTDPNAARAYRTAYAPPAPATAAANGSRLLRNAEVWKAVADGRAELEQQAVATRRRVLEELAAVAFSDLSDLFDPTGPGLRLLPMAHIPPTARRAVHRIRVRVEPNGTAEVLEVTFRDKGRALALLAKLLGMTGRRAGARRKQQRKATA